MEQINDIQVSMSLSTTFPGSLPGVPTSITSIADFLAIQPQTFFFIATQAIFAYGYALYYYNIKDEEY